MGWFSDLRDSVIKPAVGFAVAGPAGAAAVSGADAARKAAKEQPQVSYSSGLPQTSVNDVSYVNGTPTAQPQEVSRASGLNFMGSEAIIIGLVFGVMILALSGRR
jgi:hypothetical protein